MHTVYVEWTNIVLKAYKNHEKAIQETVGKLFNKDESVAENEIKGISKIWWISWCVVGSGGIINPPNDQKRDIDAPKTIAKTARVDVAALIRSIIIIDKSLAKTPQTLLPPDQFALYISPIYKIASTIDNKNHDINSSSNMDDLDFAWTMYVTGDRIVEALNVGGVAWVKANYSTVGHIPKYMEQPFYKKNIEKMKKYEYLWADER